MLKITQDYFTDMSLSYTDPDLYLGLELSKRPTALLRYGHAEKLPNTDYNSFGFKPEKVIDLNRIDSALYKNRCAPNYVAPLTGANVAPTQCINFGPLGTDALPYNILIQFIPYYILEYNILHYDNKDTLLYKYLLVEYNIRHKLYKKYNRPLDPFTIPQDIPQILSEVYYNPISAKAYRFLETLHNDTLEIYSTCNFLVAGSSLSELSLSDLKRLLHMLNSEYIYNNQDTAKTELSPIHPDSIKEGVFFTSYVSGNYQMWICSILKELQKREQEYKDLSNDPSNVLFTI